jgi:hypothetical protein
MIPLSAPVELLGVPRVRLRLAADKPVAQVAARLCKVLPDGSSWRLGYGVLNLTHRDGHADPRALVPGQWVEIDLALGFLAHRLAAGERLRLAISEGLWPLVWPSPDRPTLSLDPAGSLLRLPVRTAPAEEAPMPIRSVTIAPDPGTVVVTTQRTAGRLSVTGTWPDTTRDCANGTHLSGFGPNTVATIDPDAPDSGVWSGTRVSRYRRAGWDCELRSSFRLTADAGTFTVSESLVALQDGVQIFARDATNACPRDFM